MLPSNLSGSWTKPISMLPHIQNEFTQIGDLTERFYIHNHGCALCRAGSDMQAATSMMLGEEHNPKPKGKEPEALHKAAWSKANTLVGRLSKNIGLLESTLPALKKSLLSSCLRQVRDGLTACRQAKEDSLDTLEEAKPYSHQTLRSSKRCWQLCQTPTQSCKIILQPSLVLQKHKPPVIKGDPTAATERPELREANTTVPLRQVLKICEANPHDFSGLEVGWAKA